MFGAIDRLHFRSVEGNHASWRHAPDTLDRNLCPAARRRAKVNDAPPEQRPQRIATNDVELF